MKRAGLYVHIPFCDKKCGYCDFYSVVSHSQKPAFTNALLSEIGLVSAEKNGFLIDSVFWGGGTPTCLSEKQIQQIWQQISKKFQLDPDGEFSIEANPGTVDQNKLTFLRELGFNRISFGAQSFQPAELKFLGRIHTVEDIYDSIKWARASGFDNINIDLITAFPGLTAENFQNSLKAAASLGVEHIACYTLIFEPGTPFYRAMKKGDLTPLSADREAVFYETANAYLGKSGYQAYEISNFAKSEIQRCRHNLKYWQHEPYFGFGPSAHSFESPKRWRNLRSLKQYLESIQAGQKPVAETEILSAAELEFEYIFLNLRLSGGLNMEIFSEKFGVNFSDKYKNEIFNLLNEGYISMDQNICRLTEKGWLLADEISQYF